MQWHAISMRVEVTWTYENQDQHDDLHTLALRSCALATGRTASQGAKFRTDCQEVQDMGEFVATYVVSAYTGCGDFHYRKRRLSMLAIYARHSSKKLDAYAPARPLRACEAGQDPCIAKRRLHWAIPHDAWPACTRRYKASPHCGLCSSLSLENSGRCQGRKSTGNNKPFSPELLSRETSRKCLRHKLSLDPRTETHSGNASQTCLLGNSAVSA